MIIAHIGDTHLSARDPHMTLDEQVDLLQWVVRDAHACAAEVLLHGGDLFDKKSEPAEREAAAEVLQDWCKFMPVVLVRGNHDAQTDLDIYRRIKTIYPLHVVDAPDLLGFDGVLVGCLPWPRKALLAQAVGPDADLERAATEGLRAILASHRMHFQRSDLPTVLLGHAELGGAKLDNGQPVAGRCDVSLAEADLLQVGADAVLLSHIHKHQILGDGRICYAGSPRQTKFGEDLPKGYCLVDIERGRAPVFTHRQGPGRRLATVDGEWTGDNLRFVVDGLPGGRAFRLRYEVDASVRKQARAEAEAARDRLLQDGAHSVKIDPRVTAVSRIRSEEIRTAKTTADRLRAYWGVAGEPPRTREILDKLGSLEAAS